MSRKQQFVRSGRDGENAEGRTTVNLRHPGREDRTLSYDQRLRRVVILCCSFGQNLAFFRVLMKEPYRALCDGSDDRIWTRIARNFADHCVLEFCKLFGELKGKHGWRLILPEPETFERELLANLNMTQGEFEAYVAEHRRERDKFIAHLDSDLIMQTPFFDTALNAVAFYHKRIVGIQEHVFNGLQTDFEKGFREETELAEGFFRKQLQGRSPAG
jgi:hypothetical protein